jgi:hypothetical protein
MLVIALCGCKEKPAATEGKPVAVVPVAAKKLLETEFRGTWSNTGVSAEKVEFVVQSAACGAKNAQVLGSSVLREPGAFFAEFDLPNGAVFVCLVAKNAEGERVAAASYAKNPVTIDGDDEIKLNGVDLTLQVSN